MPALDRLLAQPRHDAKLLTVPPLPAVPEDPNAVLSDRLLRDVAGGSSASTAGTAGSGGTVSSFASCLGCASSLSSAGTGGTAGGD